MVFFIVTSIKTSNLTEQDTTAGLHQCLASLLCAPELISPLKVTSVQMAR
jgi:hypothetical protein